MRILFRVSFGSADVERERDDGAEKMEARGEHEHEEEAEAEVTCDPTRSERTDERTELHVSV